MKYLLVITAISVLNGCVNSPTVKFNSKITRDSDCLNSSIIEISSASRQPTLIKDIDTYIGEVTSKGTLSWCRPAGYVALIARPASSTMSFAAKPTHVVIFNTEANKKYSLEVDYPLRYGRIFSIMSPQNFSSDEISYQKIAEKLLLLNSEGLPYNAVLDSDWLPELNKLAGK